MWILLLVLLNVATGEQESAYRLEQYETKEQCTQDKERVTGEMAVAYPTIMTSWCCAGSRERQRKGYKYLSCGSSYGRGL